MGERRRVATSDWACIAMTLDGDECAASPPSVEGRDIESLLRAEAQPLCWQHGRVFRADLTALHEGALWPLPPGVVPGLAELAPGASITGMCVALQIDGGSCLRQVLYVFNADGAHFALPTCPHHTLTLSAWLLGDDGGGPQEPCSIEPSTRGRLRLVPTGGQPVGP